MQAPKYPDPMETAQAQGQMNKETAVTQYGLNATNQRTPQGDLTYAQIGEWDDGTPRFEATQTLSPEQQGLYESFTQGQQQFGDIANNQLGRVSETMGSPFEIDEAAGKQVADMQRQFLDPEWDRRSGNLEATLAARGLSPGGEAYNARQQEFGDQRDRAYDAMYLNARQQGVQEALAERNQPLTELTSMLSMTQPQQPQFTSTPQPGVAPVDYTGLVNNQYQARMNNYSNMMGGLFGLGSAVAAGGWARAGFPGISDRRLKTGIGRIGSDPRGFGIYQFRYLWDGPDVQRVGVMADEVAHIPGAVITHPFGFAMVDYGAL